MSKIELLFVCVLVLLMGIALPGAAQSPDFETTLVDSLDPAQSGDTVTYTVGVNNIGAGETTHDMILDVYLPSGVPADVTAYLEDDAAALAAFTAMSDSIQVMGDIWEDGVSGLFFGVDGYCENFLLQPQALSLPASVAGQVIFDAVMPELPLTAGHVYISSASLGRDLLYGRAGCADAADCHDYPCLGPRVSLLTTPVVGAVELVNDGSADPSFGCSALSGFTSGNIALIDRGTCSFEDKILNAQTAGASAVIIADSDDFTDSTVDPTDVLNMACTNYCNQTLVTIPSIFASYQDGQTIHADLGTGVQATIGKKDIGNVLTINANVWENITAAETADDSNPNNNASSEETTISNDSIFRDGFESGTTSAWSYAGKRASDGSSGTGYFPLRHR